jgi:hypothetical protein
MINLSGIGLNTMLKGSRLLMLLGFSILIVSCSHSRTETGCPDPVKEKGSMMTKELPAQAGTEVATFGMG